jgi:hypothetical protein
MPMTAVEQWEAAMQDALYVHSLGFFIFPVPEVPITQG